MEHNTALGNAIKRVFDNVNDAPESIPWARLDRAVTTMALFTGRAAA